MKRRVRLRKPRSLCKLQREVSLPYQKKSHWYSRGKAVPPPKLMQRLEILAVPPRHLVSQLAGLPVLNRSLEDPPAT
eukprot:11146129-Prorocentrum_lima.AAC.1